MKNKKQNQKGFAMLFTVLVISIILSISIGISNITFKQNILSSIAKDSQIAFFAADSGIECGLIHDMSTENFKKGSTSVPSSITCGDLTFNFSQTKSGTDYFYYEEDTSNNSVCRIIIFDKTDNSLSRVQARGYNICQESPRQVERALEARYVQSSDPTVEGILEEIRLLISAEKGQNESYAKFCEYKEDGIIYTPFSSSEFRSKLNALVEMAGAENVRCLVRTQNVPTTTWNTHYIPNDSLEYLNFGIAVYFNGRHYGVDKNGVMLLDTDDSAVYTNWMSAKNLCESSGKILPPIEVLKAIADYGGHSRGLGLNSSNYWSSTVSTYASASAYDVAFLTKTILVHSMGTGLTVRCATYI